MFKWLTSQFCSKCFEFGTGPDCKDHDLIKNPYANATNSDAMVAAGIIRVMAKDFRENKGCNWLLKSPPSEEEILRWVMDRRGRCVESPEWVKQAKEWEKVVKTHTAANRCLVSDTNNIYLSFYEKFRGRQGMTKDFQINEAPLDAFWGNKILSKYQHLNMLQERIQKEAAEAERRMKADQAKWNLAEQLLGMKRLPNCALVPKEYQEAKQQENKFSPCTSSCCAT